MSSEFSDAISGSRGGIPKDLYVLLIVVAAGIVAARILTAPGAYSANDRSRWATIRALVDAGTYSVGYREQYPDGTYKDYGIFKQPGWGGVDIVMNPDTRRFYSSKPTLLPTVLAGEYWILRNVLDLNFRQDRVVVARTILFTINLIPFVLYLLVLARLVDRLGVTDWGRLLVFTAACFGTYVSGFLGSLNNHTVGAMAALFAIYHCVRIHLDDDLRWWRFVLAGIFVGWAATNELPAATLACGVIVWLFLLSRQRTMTFALPALLLPVAAYVFTQYLATGSVMPTYAQKTWYEYPGSYWLNPKGVDAAAEPKLQYAANLLLGHTGILSLTPVLLLGWIGMVRGALRDRRPGRESSCARILAVLTSVLTVVTFVFYVYRTENYGGRTSGPRWFFWLVPLWLLTMLPEADRWAPHWRRRWLAVVLLAVSVVTASHALQEPWDMSLLFQYLRYWGVISY